MTRLENWWRWYALTKSSATTLVSRTYDSNAEGVMEVILEYFSSIFTELGLKTSSKNDHPENELYTDYVLFKDGVSAEEGLELIAGKFFPNPNRLEELVKKHEELKAQIVFALSNNSFVADLLDKVLWDLYLVEAQVAHIQGVELKVKDEKVYASRIL